MTDHLSVEFVTSVKSIKEDIQEMKPQLLQARDGVLVLGTEVKSLTSRVSALEDSENHACVKSGIINVVRDKLNDMRADSTGRFAALTHLEQELAEEKQNKKWLYGWMLGLVVPSLLAIAAWITTVSTVENEIKHLNQQMQQLSTDQRTIQSKLPHIDETLKIISEKQKTDFSKLSVVRSVPSTYEKKYQKLAPATKQRLRRLGFDEKDFSR